MAQITTDKGATMGEEEGSSPLLKDKDRNDSNPAAVSTQEVVANAVASLTDQTTPFISSLAIEAGEETENQVERGDELKEEEPGNQKPPPEQESTQDKVDSNSFKENVGSDVNDEKKEMEETEEKIEAKEDAKPSNGENSQDKMDGKDSVVGETNVPEQPNNEEESKLDQSQSPAQEPRPQERGRSKPSSPRPPQQPTMSPSRLPPTPGTKASTEIVHALFGPSVGQCWGDFSCQYSHVRGRLYASEEAVLFYSNIFGFERKIDLKYEDVFQMSLYRATSIQISVQDDSSKGDESDNTAAIHYIFKGFTDRIQTLQLLIDLWQQSQGAENMEDNEDSNPTNEEENPRLPPSRSLSPLSLRLDAPEPQTGTGSPLPPSILRSSKLSTTPAPTTSPTKADPNATQSRLFPDLSSSSSRRRSKSVPNLQRRRPKERRNSESTGVPSETGDSAAVDDGFEWDSSPTKSDLSAWEAVKQSVNPCVKEIGAEPTVLPCSLAMFFKLFLANGAAYSIDKYQRGELVKDLDVKITPWRQDSSQPNILVRTIDFRHPCGSFGVGPSHAPTKKRQQLHRYPGCGICITNSTTVEGLPGADCFVVEDQWLIEAVQQGDKANSNSNPRVTFSAKFGANFTKRTFLKSIIQKNIKSGNKEWYDGYKKMLQSALKDNLQAGAISEAAPDDILARSEDDSRQEANLLQGLPVDGRLVAVALFTSQVLLLLFLVLVLFQLRASQHTTETVLNEMKLLRIEHGQVLGLLLEQQEQE